MNTRRISQPARVGTFGRVFFLAVLLVLAWGAMRDSAHAEEVVEATPLVAAPADGNAEPAPVEEVPPAESDADPQPIDEAPVAAPVEEATPPAPVVVDEAVEVVEVVEAPPIVLTEAVPEPEPAAVEPEATPDLTPEATPVATPIATPKAVVVPVVQPATETVESAIVAPPAVHQCNADTFPITAGWEATCVVTIVNTVGSDGATSSTVTTTWCLAEAGVLPPEGCTSETVTNDGLVTTVDQCNGILAGGSNVTCSVEVINNVPSGTPTTEVTVNQCIGSGQGGVSPGGPPTDCDPPDSSTTGATVTQCNGSANGGGAPERVQCSVVGAVTAIPMTVNQCNGSTAAGSTVTCDVTFTNNFAAPVDGPGPVVPGPTPTPTPVGFTNPTPLDSDSGLSRTSGAGSSLRVSRSADRTSIATGLAATGGSFASLLSAALLLLALGGLLLGGSTRRVAS